MPRYRFNCAAGISSSGDYSKDISPFFDLHQEERYSSRVVCEFNAPGDEEAQALCRLLPRHPDEKFTPNKKELLKIVPLD